MVVVMGERVRMRIEAIEGHVREAFPVNNKVIWPIEARHQLVWFEFGFAHFAFARQYRRGGFGDRETTVEFQFNRHRSRN